MRATPVDPASPTPSGSSAGIPSGGPATAESSPERLAARPVAGDPLDPDAAPNGFLGATMAELGKVVWPSRQQLFSESVAVILMVALSAAAIAAIDRFFGWLSHQVFR